MAWNRNQDRGGRTLFVIGASRRPPRTLAPDRRRRTCACPRNWVGEGPDACRAVRARAGARLPGDFGPWNRPAGHPSAAGDLGATAQVSNLGVIEGDGLESVSMFPALSGPRGVAVGLVSTALTTTLSLRTRGGDFSRDDGAELLDRTMKLLAQA